ncbi:MAG: beta-ketoacyl-[acyl-carrier-protein] synthase family protein [Spirochaetia bacterium]|nr:beta-ketoacyl-[acyl-carrier-protein] synthase family protein [Spirochaetia bacterium]
MSDNRRVVVTGMGVITSNGHGLDEFENSLRKGKSGIRYIENLKELNFGCNVGGIPQNSEEKLKKYFSEESLLAMNEAMRYAGIASIDAWVDAGFEVPDIKDDTVHWDTGAIIGAGLGGMDTIGNLVVPRVNEKKVRRMGSTAVEQVMGSSVSAKVGGLLAIGYQLSSNSSACNTGTEAIIEASYKIKHGYADKMLAGGVEGSSPYIWAGFDAMKVLNSSSNDAPEKASRPMSASSGGFIPGSGAGILFLESLESAQKRGARIYAEILGGALNCGGQRMGGSMTAPNSTSVQRCIKKAIEYAEIQPEEIDYINGHLTGTMADPREVNNWARALGLSPDKFPYINSTKSMIGHCLGAAGSIESVGALLQLYKGFIHKSLNCEDLHEEILPYANSVVQKTIDVEMDIMAKASFGFGDVNGCLIFKKWKK